MALTQEQIDFFYSNGYLKIGCILDDALLEETRQQYDAEFEKAWQNDSYRNIAVDEEIKGEQKRRGSKQMFQILQMCDRNIHFRRLLFHQPLLDIISDLLGPNLQLFHDQALYKPAHHGEAVFWHQDNGYWECRPASLISCWMALDDAYEANGAMQVIPGSHLRPLRHDAVESSNALRRVEPEGIERCQVVEVKAGEAMIHHCQTLHYTQPNETPHDRRAHVIHYMTPGTRRAKQGGIIPVSFSNPLLRAAVS